MEFFKKHYEKLILLGLFILFIVLMLKVHSIIDETKSISAKDLDLPQRTPDHVVEKASDAKFDLTKIWQQSKTNWYGPGVLEYRAKKSEYFSDLISVFPIAACPYCAEQIRKAAQNSSYNSEFQRLIPYYYFNGPKGQNRHCPLCKKELLKPSSVKSIRTAVKTETDLDGDGIPNEEEKRYKLNENDENDALYDADGDGFSNYYEIMVAKTNPRDPQSHPPLWYRLRVASIKQIALPIKFMALNDNGKDDKKEWMLQFNTPRRGRIDRSEFAQLGESIKIENRYYKIMDIQRLRKRLEKHSDVKTNAGEEQTVREIDQSKVFLEEEIDTSDDTRLKNPDKLVMVCNETVYSSDKRPVLEDVGIPGGQKTYTVKKGNSFKIAGAAANVRIRPVTYRVVNVDAEKMTVTLEDSRGTQVVVNQEGKIPADSRIIEQVSKQNSPDDTIGGMMER